MRRNRCRDTRLSSHQGDLEPLSRRDRLPRSKSLIAHRDRHSLPQRHDIKFALKFAHDPPSDVAKRRGVIEIDWNYDLHSDRFKAASRFYCKDRRAATTVS